MSPNLAKLFAQAKYKERAVGVVLLISWRG